MFAYCGNNPVTRSDAGGNWWDTVLDVISLGASIADVALNPTDFLAWAGLIGDIVDVVVPFVGGVGEAVDALRVVDGFVEGTDSVVDAAKATSKLVSDSTGSYEIIYKSGNTYVGKGSFSRAITSATDKANKYGDEVVSLTWKSAPDSRTAFINEYISMCKHGGPNNGAIRNAQSYNKIWSPGRKYYYEDYGRYFEYDGKVW